MHRQCFAVSRFLLVLVCLISLAVQQPQAVGAEPSDVVSGKWTYRSFHNNPKLVTGTAQDALSLFFAEAVFTFDVSDDNAVAGRIDWEGGGLDLSGHVTPPTAVSPLSFNLVGAGRAGTSTQGWQYDYSGFLAPSMASGIDQVPALVGSVLRAKPHGGAPAGYVASFIAVKSE